VEKSAKRGTLYCVLFTKCYSISQIHKNTMGSACSMSGRKGWHIQDFGGGDPKEVDHLQDLRVDGKIILKGSSRNRTGRNRLD